jgi:hypothetical protein
MYVLVLLVAQVVLLKKAVKQEPQSIFRELTVLDEKTIKWF